MGILSVKLFGSWTAILYQTMKQNIKPDTEDASNAWYVYMVRCCDSSLYTGVTNNLDRRLREHNGEKPNGARYTRPRRPVTLVYSESVADRQSACRREFELKALKKPEKEMLARVTAGT